MTRLQEKLPLLSDGGGTLGGDFGAEGADEKGRKS